MKLSPVLHFLTVPTMKAFLALTFLAALSLAVSFFRLIRSNFKLLERTDVEIFNPSGRIAICVHNILSLYNH
jgi:hypothetical protein